MSAAFPIAVLSSAILSGTSLLYATLGELVGERAGIVNLGLEGLMLVGASTGFAGASLSGNPYLGVAAGALAGLAANLLFGYVVITRHANQLASGLSLTFFGLGASALIGRPFAGAIVTGLPRLGPFDLLVWLAAPLAAILWGLLHRTLWGLALRAVGEAPAAVFAAGRRPDLLQYEALAVAALVIFAGWNPLRAVVGALVFGGAESLQLQFQARGVDISPFLMNMVPDVLTLLVLIFWGLRRQSAAPAALGRNFFGVE